MSFTFPMAVADTNRDRDEDGETIHLTAGHGGRCGEKHQLIILNIIILMMDAGHELRSHQSSRVSLTPLKLAHV